MKTTILSIFIMLSIQSIAQDSASCASCVKNEYGYYSTKRFLISHDAGKTGFIFEIMLGGGNESAIFSVKTLGAGNCIKANNVMRITFVDSTLIGVIGSHKYNCTGMSTFYYSPLRENMKDLEWLKTKLVKSIYIETEQGDMERKLTITEAKLFQKNIICLMRHWREK